MIIELSCISMLITMTIAYVMTYIHLKRFGLSKEANIITRSMISVLGVTGSYIVSLLALVCIYLTCGPLSCLIAACISMYDACWDIHVVSCANKKYNLKWFDVTAVTAVTKQI